MTKYTKYVVMGAGLIGLIAFFMPLLHVKQGGFEGKASAFAIMKGIDQAAGQIGEVEAAAGAAGQQEASRALAEARSSTSTAKWLFLVPFLFPALFLITGLLGLVRRFGRGMGALTLLFGLIGIALWFFLRAAGDVVASEAKIDNPLGFGVTVLGLSYFVGSAAGLFALISPEPRK